MRKVGLLTMPVKENYGGIIQVAALYSFLENNGYKPYLIRKKYDEKASKRLVRWLLSHNPLYFIYDYKNLAKRERQSSKLKVFIKEFFVNKTKESFNRIQYENSIQGLDSVIVGSDQVWRYKYVRNNYRYYFLDFLAPNMEKVSYAASFGIDEWEGEKITIDTVKELLNKFNAVSVREKSAVDLCKSTFDYNEAVHVLDPTFLPDVSFYDELINKERIQKEVRLFTYVLDNSAFVNEVVHHIGDALNLEIDTITLTDYQFSANPSISEWLHHFREADFIVTDSFHGTVFSILFKKQFICIGNSERGYSRFESLLDILNLKDRLIFDYTEQNISNLLQNKIDYDKVEVLKREQVEASKEFLINSLNNA